jgi:hypothetical protein
LKGLIQWQDRDAYHKKFGAKVWCIRFPTPASTKTSYTIKSNHDKLHTLARNPPLLPLAAEPMLTHSITVQHTPRLDK